MRALIKTHSKSLVATLMIVLSVITMLYTPIQTNAAQTSVTKCTMRVGEKTKLLVVCNGKIVSNKKVKFTNNSKSLISINKSGIVTAKKVGKATVIAKYKSNKIKYLITVKKAKSTELKYSVPSYYKQISISETEGMDGKAILTTYGTEDNSAKLIVSTYRGSYGIAGLEAIADTYSGSKGEETVRKSLNIPDEYYVKVTPSVERDSISSYVKLDIEIGSKESNEVVIRCVDLIGSYNGQAYYISDACSEILGDYKAGEAADFVRNSIIKENK